MTDMFKYILIVLHITGFNPKVIIMSVLDNQSILQVYRTVSKIASPDLIVCLDNCRYTMVEFPYLAETLIGRYIVSDSEDTLEQFVEDTLRDSVELKKAIVENIIKPNYEYVPSGVIEMIVSKSRKSISCGSTWPQIQLFVQHVMEDKGINKKVSE